MPTLIPEPVRVEAAGNKPKLIDEYVGRLNTGHQGVSVAHMRSPGGWIEPGQTPEFDEFTVVLAGRLRVTSASGDLDVVAGQAVVVPAGEWAGTRRPTPTAPSTSPSAPRPSPPSWPTGTLSRTPGRPA